MNRISFFLLLPFFFITVQLEAQVNAIPVSENDRNQGKLPEQTVLTVPNAQPQKCIPDDVREEVRQRIETNKARIKKDNPDTFEGNRGSHPLFILPIQPKEGFDDYGYYATRFFVDHNSSFNQHEDYNCGERTYDWSTGDHEGTDFVIWPYPWKYMEESVMEVRAAAEGTIVDKQDGNFDMNCQNNGNPNWNGIVIEHPDGSQAWYWHFKDGGITSKEIGETVETGEFLGVAGSSGSSSYPHLHFEIYDFEENLIDPFIGDCNAEETGSWWESQPDYYEPQINHISTHISPQLSIDCPTPEVTHEAENFIIGDTLVLRVFYRDLMPSSVTTVRIWRGIQNVASWEFTNPWGYYDAADAYWQYVLDDSWLPGNYVFQAEYEGVTYSSNFTIATEIGVEEVAETELNIYPNPAEDFLHVVFPAELVGGDLLVSDAFGRAVIRGVVDKQSMDLGIEDLASGVYFLRANRDDLMLSKRFVVK
ncbi:peptidoglycan DD-metalloendopeptidase family protein [Halocola ammonii]